MSSKLDSRLIALIIKSLAFVSLLSLTTIALSALKGSLAAEQLATKIDGFTPEQRCFIAWRQLWKAKFRPEILRELVQTNAHPPSEFRVTGSLVNLPEFSSTFDIKKGDPLWRDPADQVKIW